MPSSPETTKRIRNARATLTLTCIHLLGCASGPHRLNGTEDYGFEANSSLVWVRGPWEAIHPSKDIDEVIDQLCPAVMELPGARARDHGQEYCGVIYPFVDGLYHASVPSPLKKMELVGASKSKSCFVPFTVRDARGPVPEPTADFHGHPWPNSPMSEKDRIQRNQRHGMRIQFDANCRIQKLVPHVHEDRPGEVYERRDRSWKLIGYIQPEDKDSGKITPVQD